MAHSTPGENRYLDHLAAETVLPGFPRAGGGWDGRDLVIMDREEPRGPHGELHLGELESEAGMETPALDSLLACLPRPAAAHRKEKTS